MSKTTETGPPESGGDDGAWREELRRRAEARVSVPNGTVEGEDLGAIILDLQTHQIELEMQNEELRRAQDELAASRDRYSDLYDSAPVGYVTISQKGLILEANLTLARMLDVERRALVNQPLSSFIIPDDQDVLYQHQRVMLESGRHDTCCLRVRRREAGPLWVEMNSIRMESGDEGGRRLQITIMDITDRRLLEQKVIHLERMRATGELAVGWVTISTICSQASSVRRNYYSAAAKISRCSRRWRTF